MQLKLSLRGVVKPPVWRRLLVPADIRLDRLHEVIQTAIGWTDTHLHVFSTRAIRFARQRRLRHEDRVPSRL